VAPPASTVVDPNAEHLVAAVSRKDIASYGNGPTKILAVDCGMKANIIRQLASRDSTVTCVPHDAPFASMLKDYDGLFLSNGPGDPTMCKEAIGELRKVMAETDEGKIKPVFGICLGNQIMGLAAGAETRKLPFGNR